MQLFSAALVEGRVTISQGRLPDRLAVEVVADGRKIDKEYLSEDGSFMFRNLPTGNYEIRVVDAQGDTLRQDFVTVGPHSGPITLQIMGIRQDRPASGSVSLKELHPMPRKTRSELARSQKAFRKGKPEEALLHLNQALETCSDCAQVHTGLGNYYIRTGDAGKAVQAFRRAVDLDPDSAMTWSNLAVALVANKEFQGGEEAARKALAEDSGSMPARYALGISSIALKKCTQEAADHLRAAAGTFPRAHLSAATALTCMGDTDGAISELTTYLSTSAPQDRETVERWLAGLQKQAGNASNSFTRHAGVASASN